MLDVHAEALQSVNDAYHSFLLRFNRARKVVYGFVEGKDDPSFYRSVIERFIPDEWSVDLVRAGNRDKVLAAERAVDWTRFSREQLAFFVDRDLTDFTDAGATYPSNVYVTDAYSIENSIVTADVMLHLLAEVHNVVDWDPDERDALVEHFNRQLENFASFMIPLMAQILIWREDKAKANLDNLDLGSIFDVSGGEFSVRACYSDVEARVERLCGCVGALKSKTSDRVARESSLTAAGGAARFVRGKYLIWFLAEIVNGTHQAINRFIPAYSFPPKSKLSIGRKNVMVVAAPRARIPGSLRHFIQNGFVKFTEAAHTA
jgi:hypothetical protein